MLHSFTYRQAYSRLTKILSEKNIPLKSEATEPAFGHDRPEAKRWGTTPLAQALFTFIPRDVHELFMRMRPDASGKPDWHLLDQRGAVLTEPAILDSEEVMLASGMAEALAYVLQSADFYCIELTSVNFNAGVLQVFGPEGLLVKIETANPPIR